MAASPSACAGLSYTDGRWVPRAGPPAYRLTPESFTERFTSKAPELRGHLFAAACDDPRHTRTDAVRRHYEWLPHRCTLEPLQRASACGLLESREIRQIVVVGDSLSAQFFLSLVMLLESLDGLGPPVKDTRVPSLRGGFADKTAVACGGRVRLKFVRNDLLLWSNSGVETNLVRRCSQRTLLHGWITHALHDADLLILGLGGHFPLAMSDAAAAAAAAPLAPAEREQVASAVEAFAAHSLQLTLSELVQQRGARYGYQPASVVLVGSPMPLPGCARFAAPVRRAEALLRANRSASGYAAQWEKLQILGREGQCSWFEMASPALFVGRAPSASLDHRPLRTPARRLRSLEKACARHSGAPLAAPKMRFLFHVRPLGSGWPRSASWFKNGLHAV